MSEPQAEHLSERSDPSALRWLIGVELANYRKQSGLSLAQVSQLSGITKPKLGNMEAGRFQQYPDDIATVLRVYGVAERDIDRLCALAGSSDRRAWWAPWSHVVPDWVQTFVGLEGLATSEFVYEPTIVPGILQVEDYAEELTRATGFVRSDHHERFVSFRLARAERLTRPKPLHVHAVVSESALTLRVGSRATRNAQYHHLLALAALPNVVIQVVRPEAGPHAAATGPFYLFNFELARPIGYVELLDGAVYVQDVDQIGTYRMAADSVVHAALSPTDTVDFIHSLISGNGD